MTELCRNDYPPIGVRGTARPRQPCLLNSAPGHQALPRGPAGPSWQLPAGAVDRRPIRATAGICQPGILQGACRAACRGLHRALPAAPVAQLDRAPDYESGGWRFESFRVRHYFQWVAGRSSRSGGPSRNFADSPRTHQRRDCRLFARNTRNPVFYVCLCSHTYYKAALRVFPPQRPGTPSFPVRVPCVSAASVSPNSDWCSWCSWCS